MCVFDFIQNTFSFNSNVLAMCAKFIESERSSEQMRENSSNVLYGVKDGNDDCFVLFNKLYCVHNNKPNSLFICAHHTAHTHWHRYREEIYSKTRLLKHTHTHTYTLIWIGAICRKHIPFVNGGFNAKSKNQSQFCVLNRVAGGLDSEI